MSTPSPAAAQFWPTIGGRIPSRDGRWLTPVAGGLLSSTEEDHTRRGSVYAWDISVPLGTYVFPMAAGRVSYAGCNNAGGYGCWVLVDHGDGYLSLYGHFLDEGGGQVKVQTGDRVNLWTPIGRVGWTGMTSFGPHVHWEIHHVTQGRQRLDAFFSPSALPYCKLCAADASTVQNVTGIVYVGGGLLNRELIAGVVLLLLAALLFFQPELVALGLQRAGDLVYSVLYTSQGVWRRAHRTHSWQWVTLLLVFFIPAFLCSTGTAIAVWMADEDLDPRTLLAYVRYGLYPFPGHGYQPGARYAAVWGIPCHEVGSLGHSCEVHDIVAKSVDWQREVMTFSRSLPIPVVIPRLGGRFDVNEARGLLNEMHYIDGLVVIDVGSDFHRAHEIVDALVGFGLDGIAIDMEFTDIVQRRDIEWLAEDFGQKRKQAGLEGQGVLVLWNVFHNLEPGKALESPNVQIVPIFTGYGSLATKRAGLAATQALFAVDATESGMMAFDQRWPINQQCKTFDTHQGFDCQDWHTLFADPPIGATGWWVQQ
ncbi:MAG: M23 family metallopeptidase [Caldilineaceae bacterium]